MVIMVGGNMARVATMVMRILATVVATLAILAAAATVVVVNMAVSTC